MKNFIKIRKIFSLFILSFALLTASLCQAQVWRNLVAIEHETTQEAESEDSQQTMQMTPQGSVAKLTKIDAKKLQIKRGQISSTRSFSKTWQALDESASAKTFSALKSSASSEGITDEFTVVAQSLGNDENAIIQFVQLEIKNEPYYGLKKSPLQTLQERSGNDYDKTALAIKILKAAGIEDYMYMKSWYGYSINGSNKYSLQRWLGMPVSNIQTALKVLNGGRIPYLSNEENLIVVSRIYLKHGDYIYDLTDVLKTYHAGIGLSTSVSSIFAGLTGSSFSGYTGEAYGFKNMNIDHLPIDIKDVAITITENSANVEKKKEDIIGRFSTQISTGFSEDRLYHPLMDYESPPESDYAYLQFFRGAWNTSEANLTIATDSSGQALKIKLADLNGDRIWTSFDGNNFHINRNDESISVWTRGSSGNVHFKTEIVLYEDSLNVYQTSALKRRMSHIITQSNQSVYNIVYLTSPSKALLNKAKRDASIAMREARNLGYVEENGNFIFNSNSAYTDIHKKMVSQCLHVMALEWLYQTHSLSKTIGLANECDVFFLTRLGRTAQEYSARSGKCGFFIDVPINDMLIVSESGTEYRAENTFKLASVFMSALEHTVIQQLQSQKEAISTVNALKYGNQKGASIRCAYTSDVNSLANIFVNNVPAGYGDSEHTEMRNFLTNPNNIGAIVLAPHVKTIQPNTWDWVGGGYMMISNAQAAMIITGGYSGGYAAHFDPISMPELYDYDRYSSNPYSYNPTNMVAPYTANFASSSIPNLYSFDPVNMNTGAYVYDNADISIGPWLSFSRSYDSGLAGQSNSGLGYGWTHNYDMTLKVYGDSEFVLDSPLARDSAYLLSSIYMAKAMLESSYSATTSTMRSRDLFLMCMIAGSGVDSIIDNSVSIKMGKESMSFKKKFRKVVANTTNPTNPRDPYNPYNPYNPTNPRDPTNPKNPYNPYNPNNPPYERPTPSDSVFEDYFEAPTGTNLKLEKSGSGNDETYVVHEPYGSKMIFKKYDGDFKISVIKEAFNRRLNFEYNTTPSHEAGRRLVKVNDGGFNNLYFNWAIGASPRIASVSDGTRTVSYTYSTETVSHNNTGIQDRVLRVDLTGFQDELGNTWTYEYDDESRLTRLVNPKNETVIENFYSDKGMVYKQYNSGDPTKVWELGFADGTSFEKDPNGYTKFFQYDDKGFPISTTNQLGHKTSTVYDDYGRVTKQTLPNGDEIRITYNKWHNKLSEDFYEKSENTYVWKSGTVYVYEDANAAGSDVPRLKKITQRSGEGATTGRTTTINDYLANTYFEANGPKTNRPISITDEKGIVTTYEYEYYGNLLAETVGGRTTRYSNYTNVFDKPQRITPPDGVATNITYNGYGDVSTSTTAGVTTTYTYDARRRVVKTSLTGAGITNPIESIVEYDSADNVVRTVDSEGLVSTSTYTSQLKKLTDTVGTGANAQTTTYVYDLADRLVKTISSDGKEVEYTLDEVGQTIESTFAGRTTSMEYDIFGRNVKTTSPMNIEVSFTYDALGNKTSMTDGRGQTVNYSYNVYGEQTSLINRRNGIFLMNNDIANKQSFITTPMGKVSTVKYSPTTWDVVETIPASGNANKTTFAYNGAGQITRTTDTVGTINYTYDSNARLQKVSTANSSEDIIYAYDILGRIISSTAEGKKVNYTYTVGGKISSIIYPAQNGISAKNVNYFYDDLGRLSIVKDWANRETYYTYDTGNRLTRIDRPNGTYRTLAYDNATGELLKIEERTASNIPIMIHGFTYDDDSRIIKNFRVPIEINIDRESVVSAFNLDNQLTTFEWGGASPMSATPQYDANGNMTFGAISEKRAVYFNYDARNRLTYADGVTYSYDSENNRKTVTYTSDNKTITNSFIYDRSGSLANVLVRNKTVSDGGEGTTSVTQSTYYIQGAGLNYEVSFDENGDEIDIKYYHYDQVGSTIALTDDNENITDKFSYDTWGYVSHTEGNTDTPYLYVGIFGIQTDSNGLINMRARYYNPTTQTFITSDPTGFAGGMNWYLYANGNSLMYIDPNGKTAVDNALFLTDFILGINEDNKNRVYTEGKLLNEFVNSPAGLHLKNEFYKNGMQTTNKVSYGTGLAAFETLWRVNNISMQVGGYGGATAVNNGNGTVTYTVENTAGLKSFAYHMCKDRESKTGSFTNIKQTFIWTEDIDLQYNYKNNILLTTHIYSKYISPTIGGIDNYISNWLNGPTYSPPLPYLPDHSSMPVYK